MKGLQQTDERRGKNHSVTRKTKERTKKGRPQVSEIKDGCVYTVDQVASLLQVGAKTVRAILRRREMLARKVGQEWRVLGVEIIKYMADFRPINHKEEE